MRFQTVPMRSAQKVCVEDHLPKTDGQAMCGEILTGLCSKQKYVPSMYFYDATGSKLFERITRLPEYYLTRIERSLIREKALQINRHLCNADIVEIGSGDCSKITILLMMVPHMVRSSIRYVPVDVCRSAIEESADSLSSSFPHITIHGIVADFITQLHVIPEANRRLFCFFGSTIGNLSRDQITLFFERLNEIMQSGDLLLLGLDRVKDKAILENAYNDSQAVTAAFNRNILKVVNNLVGTDFNPSDFEHVAFYNERHERIEMHLKAREQVSITCPHLNGKIKINRGETIHTENSHKFTESHIENLGELSCLEIEDIMTDKKKWFSLVQFIKQVEDDHAGSEKG